MKKTVKSYFQPSPMLLLLALANSAAAAPRMTMAFQGDWDSAYGAQKGYQKGDVVSFNSALYQSLVSKNKLAPGPSNVTKWRIVLEAAAGSGGGSTVGPDCDHPAAGANLVGCDYTNSAKLYGKDLRGSQLINATLAGDLGLVNLDGANLVGAKLGVESSDGGGEALTLQGSLQGSESYTSRAYGANFSSSQTPSGYPLQASSFNFRSANLTDINWYGANLASAYMMNSILINANLINCIATGADFSHADLRSATLWYAKLDGAFFYAVDLSRAELEGVDLSNADLRNANMSYAILTAGDGPSNLAGADLSGADLTGADFTDVIGGDSVIYTSATKFDGTICPDGIKVNGSSVTSCQGHGFGAPQ